GREGLRAQALQCHGEPATTGCRGGGKAQRNGLCLEVLDGDGSVPRTRVADRRAVRYEREEQPLTRLTGRPCAGQPADAGKHKAKHQRHAEYEGHQPSQLWISSLARGVVPAPPDLASPAPVAPAHARRGKASRTAV